MLADATEGRADLAKAVSRWENKGGAPGRVESVSDKNWFVPPLLIPALIAASMFARFVYLAHES
jgi:hypothetical protein